MSPARHPGYTTPVRPDIQQVAQHEKHAKDLIVTVRHGINRLHATYRARTRQDDRLHGMQQAVVLNWPEAENVQPFIGLVPRGE
jgi:hypothetical protein